MHKFKYKWYLSDGYPAQGIEKNDYNVFGTFICGGGSTMGYKLAGFNHLGGVEIDKQVANIYKLNHNPKYLYNEDIRKFNKREDLPSELYSLDLLDGSPPCSTFSMAGSREKAWGKEKVFREGQAMQTLDDLVFVYIDTIEKLKPKVCLLENVKGIIQGNAKNYSKEIVKRLNAIGYNVQVFCLNAATMGVPQKRERVFFIGHLKEYDLPKLKLEFNEKPITFGEIAEYDCKKAECYDIKESFKIRYEYMKYGDADLRAADFRYCGKKNFFSDQIIYTQAIPCTITSNDNSTFYDEIKQIGTYPLDYDFQDIKPKYLIGMSVPPVMTAQIANQIRIQWLDVMQSKYDIKIKAEE